MTLTDIGMPHGLDLVPRLPEGAAPLNRKSFTSDQEVCWCPGCGDYAILSAVQSFLPELGVAPENVVVVSGIGCSSRFPYYVDTYGMHSIHGRAPAIATGVAVARPDLSVWVATGDGDALSIGGNHLIHAMRRNVNLKILLFNNEIYGLTKGQYSPTSPTGTVTKSTPTGSVDRPFNPVSLALGSEATFVARTMDSDRKHFTEVLRAAAAHRGTALIEILQNCPIFNDGAYDVLKDRTSAQSRILWLEAGEEVTVGAEKETVAVWSGGSGINLIPRSEAEPALILHHDPAAADPSQAFALSRLDDPALSHIAMGIFRQVSAPAYDDGVRAQVDAARSAAGPVDDAAMEKLLAGGDTWTVGES